MHIAACASRSPGKERDTESGLDYFGARYYASSMGRWMSSDSNDDPDSVPYADLDNPQTLNLYGYVTNNPVRLYDPTGHSGCCDVLPTMEEVDAGIAYLEAGLATASRVSVGTVIGTLGLIGQQIFAPASLGDPAETRFLRMQAQHGKNNIGHPEDYAHLTDAELQDLYDDPKTTVAERQKIKAEQKRRNARGSRQSNNKKARKETLRNDPASIRARQQQAKQTPTLSEDNSTVTTTQQDKLPQPQKD